MAHRPVPLPRVDNIPPTQEDLVPRVPASPTEADCHVRLVGDTLQIIESTTPRQRNHKPPTARPPTKSGTAQIQLTKETNPLRGYHEPHSARPNYITQDKSDEPRQGYNTQLRTTSIMQEAMLACIDITKPQFKISPASLAAQKFSMTWLCKMANSVINKKGKLVEYRHLIKIQIQDRCGRIPTEMNLDDLHRACRATQMARTPSSSSHVTKSQKKGQKTSPMA